MGRSDKQRQSNMDNYTTRGGPTRGATDASDAAEPDPHTPQQVDNAMLAGMLQELKEGQGSITAKMNSLVSKVDLMQVRLGEIGACTTEAERRIGGAEDDIHQLNNKVVTLEQKMKAVVDQVEDLEGRSRWNNIQIIGIPEGRETGKFELFIENLILKVLDEPRLSAHFVIERAHRVLGAMPAQGAASRAVVARVLNFRDADANLRRAREIGEVPYEAGKLMFFPDFSQAVQRSQKSFVGVRPILRSKNIQYATMFPANLKILKDGVAHFFTDRAMEFVEQLKSIPRPSSPRSPSAPLNPD